MELPTPKQYMNMLKYIREIANLMFLRDWEIGLSETPAAEGNKAEVRVTPNMQFATISINPDLFDETEEEIRYYITHELIHIHLAQMERSMFNFNKSMSKEIWRSMLKSHVSAEECATDALARSLAQFMPLPKGV